MNSVILNETEEEAVKTMVTGFMMERGSVEAVNGNETYKTPYKGYNRCIFCDKPISDTDIICNGDACATKLIDNCVADDESDDDWNDEVTDWMINEDECWGN